MGEATRTKCRLSGSSKMCPNSLSYGRWPRGGQRPMEQSAGHSAGEALVRGRWAEDGLLALAERMRGALGRQVAALGGDHTCEPTTLHVGHTKSKPEASAGFAAAASRSGRGRLPPLGIGRLGVPNVDRNPHRCAIGAEERLQLRPAPCLPAQLVPVTVAHYADGLHRALRAGAGAPRLGAEGSAARSCRCTSELLLRSPPTVSGVKPIMYARLALLNKTSGTTDGARPNSAPAAQTPAALAAAQQLW